MEQAPAKSRVGVYPEVLAAAQSPPLPRDHHLGVQIQSDWDELLERLSFPTLQLAQFCHSIFDMCICAYLDCAWTRSTRMAKVQCKAQRLKGYLSVMCCCPEKWAVERRVPVHIWDTGSAIWRGPKAIGTFDGGTLPAHRTGVGYWLTLHFQ